MSVAILATVVLVVASLSMAAVASEKQLQAQTDSYESLRLAGSIMMQDARFAVRPACDWDYLRLYTGGTPTDYIEYRFASWDGSPWGSPDASHLHRWVVQGGVLIRDDIIGWDLVPPDLFDPWYGTWFDCATGARDRRAVLHLLKAPPPGGSSDIHLETTAFLR